VRIAGAVRKRDPRWSDALVHEAEEVVATVRAPRTKDGIREEIVDGFLAWPDAVGKEGLRRAEETVGRVESPLVRASCSISLALEFWAPLNPS
jgi:hypothetical protein